MQTEYQASYSTLLFHRYVNQKWLWIAVLRDTAIRFCRTIIAEDIKIVHIVKCRSFKDSFHFAKIPPRVSTLNPKNSFQRKSKEGSFGHRVTNSDVNKTNLKRQGEQHRAIQYTEFLVQSWGCSLVRRLYMSPSYFHFSCRVIVYAYLELIRGPSAM
jgi:hypothetical protein